MSPRNDDADGDTDTVRFLGPPADLDAPEPHHRRANGLMFAAALLVALAVAVTARNVTSRPNAPSTASALTRTSDLALASAAHYAVSQVAVRPGQQVLWVDYLPTPTTRYAGGTVTLYASRQFDGRAFALHAQRIVVDEHVAFVGTYQHQLSVAWPVRGGRWVCLTGFIGTGNRTDPDVARVEELTVASAVVVR